MTNAELLAKFMPTLRKPVERDEMALARQVERGQRANALLTDEMLVEALQLMDDSFQRTWETSGPLDVDTRERAWMAKKILAEFRNHLRSTVESGSAASKTMTRLIQTGH